MNVSAMIDSGSISADLVSAWESHPNYKLSDWRIVVSDKRGFLATGLFLLGIVISLQELTDDIFTFVVCIFVFGTGGRGIDLPHLWLEREKSFS